MLRSTSAKKKEQKHSTLKTSYCAAFALDTEYPKNRIETDMLMLNFSNRIFGFFFLSFSAQNTDDWTKNEVHITS